MPGIRFGKLKISIFGPGPRMRNMRFRASMKTTSARKEPWHGQESREMRENVVFGTCSKNRVQNRRQSPQRARAWRSKKCGKCVVFAMFSLKHAQRKPDVSLGSPKMRPFKPHQSSGNAENGFPEPRNKNNICGQMSKKRVKTHGFRNISTKARKSELKRV